MNQLQQQQRSRAENIKKNFLVGFFCCSCATARVDPIPKITLLYIKTQTAKSERRAQDDRVCDVMLSERFKRKKVPTLNFTYISTVPMPASSRQQKRRKRKEIETRRRKNIFPQYRSDPYTRRKKKIRSSKRGEKRTRHSTHM